ncbi:hypothetical protein [Bacillus altitudinis]|uniref:hypothetical protein n=1 Tax=Bacillus altitudinis TaxID=293387 RepID=UPI002100C479|nr:hypothetical protein [Bacillus altitudinis]UTV34865.1 hypothetical protein NM966_19925 [Bacillus altitudinis]
MEIKKYKQLQIIKHALQYYVNRIHFEDETQKESELNLLHKVEEAVEEMKKNYNIQ